MKKISLILLTAFSAYGATSKLIVSKTSGGGMRSPEQAGYERCDLYRDSVVITHQLGMAAPTAVQVTESRRLAIKGDLLQLVERAKEERVEEKPNFLCDGPSTSVIANPNQGEGVTLFSTGGCGGPRQERVGVNSAKLRNIIDLYCANTFDFGSDR